MAENEEVMEAVKEEAVDKHILKDIPGVEGHIFLRKFDTEDLMTLRNEGLDTIVDPITGNEQISMKLGAMIKWNVILGIRSAPFFSKTITEERGAAPVINSRLSEFRKIPAQAIDYLFQKVKNYNVIQYDDEFQKK